MRHVNVIKIVINIIFISVKHISMNVLVNLIYLRLIFYVETK